MIVDDFLRMGWPREAKDRWFERISRSSVVKVDNVAQFLADNPEWIRAPEGQELKQDFPNLAPPWRECWLEFNEKSFGKYYEGGLQFGGRSAPSEHWGIYCFSEKTEAGGHQLRAACYSIEVGLQPMGLAVVDLSPDGRISGIRKMPEAESIYLDALSGVKNDCVKTGLVEPGSGGRIVDKAIAEERHRLVLLGLRGIEIDRALLRFQERRLAAIRTDLDKSYVGLVDVAFRFFKTLCLPMLGMTFSLSNCRNVETVPTAISPPLLKKRIVKGLPTTRYYTLVIKPMGARHRTAPGVDSEDTTPRSQHLCRGHFKTFTPDKPLFGRVVGTFWWESQVRGDRKVGVITKEYAIDDSVVEEKGAKA